MIKQVYAETEDRMRKAVESIARELASIRTGKATTALLDGIKVDYYGTQMPLNQVASISTPERRLLVIQPWEKALIQEITKAILKSELGLTPGSDGNVIRLPIPPLNEDRRRELVKLVKKHAEEGKIAVRNIRRDANENLKKAKQDKKISEDDEKQAEKHIQELTDKYIEAVDKVIKAKEAEIMEV